MEEDQIGEELLFTDVQRHLSPDEGEAIAQFEHGAGEVVHHRVLDQPFSRRRRETEEVQHDRIAGGLLGEIAVRCR